MDKKNVRAAKMLDILRAARTLTIAEMSKALACSEMTVRRCLKSLPAEYPVKMINGVIFYDDQTAMLGNDLDAEYEVSVETVRYNTEKERIGRFAAAMVEDGDIIIIDGGTTTEKMIAPIDESNNVTALCYNYNILVELHKKPNMSIILAGGYYHTSTSMFESDSGIDLINQLRANKLFLSCAGVHQRLGLTNAKLHESPTVQAAIASSLQRILLVDSNKFGLIRPAYIAPLSDIDTVITDSALSPEWQRIIKDAGISLHLV